MSEQFLTIWLHIIVYLTSQFRHIRGIFCTSVSVVDALQANVLQKEENPHHTFWFSNIKDIVWANQVNQSFHYVAIFAFYECLVFPNNKHFLNIVQGAKTNQTELDQFVLK